MRYESSITSLSWIPSEAVGGTTRCPSTSGMAHYDPPPPDELGDLDELRAADRFRFANRLAAWIEVDRSGKITERRLLRRRHDRQHHGARRRR